MPQNLKDLLEKINQEGVKLGEEKAKAIESKAKNDAERMLENARIQAKKIIEEARLNAEKSQTTGELALKHSSRDLILSLKDEIRKILDKIIAAEVSKAMTHEEIAGILKNLIERHVEKDGKISDIKVLLKQDDLGKLKNTFIVKLKERFKDGIEFKLSQNINAGFSISFDNGKSFFDFSDEGLVEALSAYLNPELARLLK